MARGLTNVPPSDDPEGWEAYRETMRDLQEDIRWLRTNPLYGHIQRNTQDLVFVQNRLVTEAVSTDLKADKSLLFWMCRIFVESGDLERAVRDGDAESKFIYDFADLNCERLRLPGPGH